MSKRVPAFDLSTITAETAEPMREGTQRAAVPAIIAEASATPDRQSHQEDPEATKTSLLESLSFRVAPEFRKRFRQRALEADLKLNELLFAALDAWEEKQKGK